MHSSPRAQCAISAARFDCVPEGKKSPASWPKRSAHAAWRRFTVGSSPKTSSPTAASAMARRMAADGCVTVSLRRSIIPPLSQALIHLLERRRARAELALAQLVERLRHGIQVAVQVLRIGIEVQQPRHDLAGG